MKKPQYSIPSMTQISRTKKNGFSVASTFSGSGGSCLGYKMAGFDVKWANEFEPTAAAIYSENHAGTVLDTRSIRDVHGQDILDAVGPIDVLDGSPPCQSFSMAGKRSEGWGENISHADGTTQVSDDLFFEYARLLGELQPKAFIAENVKGMVIGIAKGYFKEIMKALSDQGYRIEARVLNSQWLGVPQSRERVIIMGIRNDLDATPRFPKPLSYRYSILEACPWLVDFDQMVVDPHSPTFPTITRDIDSPSPTITTQRAYHSKLVQKRGRFNTDHEVDIPLGKPAPTVTTMGLRDSSGAKSIVLRTRLQVHRNSGHDDQRFRALDEPAAAITAVEAGDVKLMTDETERTLTIAEVMRLCSYPDDFKFQGSYDQQWARLGNSVPPLMMRAVARTLAKQLKEIS